MKNNKGIFIAAKLSKDSQKQLKNFGAIIGIPPKSIKDLHLTLAYSKVPIKYKCDKHLDVHLTATRVAVIGDYVAVLVEGKWVRDEWRKIRAAGATWDYPGFIPHISLIKIKKGSNYNLNLGDSFIKDIDLVISSTYSSRLKDG